MATSKRTRSDDRLFALFDVLGQRWTLRILWELRSEPLVYRDLAYRVPGLSTSVLTHRLRDLREASLVEHEPGAGYRLSSKGNSLLEHVESLRQWSEREKFSR